MVIGETRLIAVARPHNSKVDVEEHRMSRQSVAIGLAVSSKRQQQGWRVSC